MASQSPPSQSIPSNCFEVEFLQIKTSNGMFLTWLGRVFSSFYCGPLSCKSPLFAPLHCTTAPDCKPELVRAAVKVGSARREVKFGNIRF